MLVHDRKYTTEDKLEIHKQNTAHEKQTTQNTAKQNYPSLVAFYNTRPGNKVALLYNAPKSTSGTRGKGRGEETWKRKGREREEMTGKEGRRGP